MAAKKNPLADKAYELYKSGMKLVEIANQLGKPEGTIRRWKNTYNWDNERSDSKANEQSERSDLVSWVEIEHEYVTDLRKKPCSLETLAKKYSIPIQTIMDQSAKGKWSDKRRQYKEETKRKALEKASDADADRIARLLSIADKAADKAEQALGELEQYVVKDKKKVRTVEYKDNTAIGKPTKEVIDETEHINIADGPVDRLGLSQVTAALKNIKEIYSLPVDLEDKRYKAEFDKKRAEMLYVNYAGNGVDKYVSLVTKAAATGKVLVLGCEDAEAAKAALEVCKAGKPILNGANASNYEEMSKLATEAGVVLGVSGANIDELHDTVEAIEKLGNKNLVLDTTEATIKETFATTVQVRRASLKDTDRTFGYPSIVNLAKIAQGDRYMQQALLRRMR